MQKYIDLIGFGSQGATWAQCLKKSGWEVRVFLSRRGPSYEKASSLGFKTLFLNDLSQNTTSPPAASTRIIAFLCPDSEISSIYREYLAPIHDSLLLILAHGYAIYAQDLQPARPNHQVALLAPKAIGPELLSEFLQAFPEPHRLSAAVSDPGAPEADLAQIARDLGFDQQRLIPASFDQEAIGDLISEQGLLCGGIFTLLEWTFQAMESAGVPAALIREECLTELELIARMLRQKGPATTLRSISQAAQAGTIQMQSALEQSNAHEAFQRQVGTILTKEFVNRFKQGKWKSPLSEFAARLETWEKRLPSPPAGTARSGS